MRRRHLLALAAALPLPALAQPAAARPIRFVPQANLASLDPIWTTATVTRNHAYMVYDTLFGVDAGFRPQPQMAEGATTEEDGRRVTITLRPGLRFHDGEAVRARDAVASIRRWMKRSPFGQKAETLTEELTAADDRRIVFRLKRPFPLLLAGLGSPSSPVCFVMPERIAATDAFQQIREAIGSGPYRFKAEEFVSGSLAAYEKFEGYVPTPGGTPSLIAGPKQVHIPRVEWRIITDPATAAAALQSGEVDWFEEPAPELQQLLRRNRAIAVEKLDERAVWNLLRFNHLHPPFDDPAMRRALLPAIQQRDFSMAIVGPDPADWVEDVGIFTPGTPLANTAGLELLLGPRSLDRARALLKEAGYTNQPVRLIGPTDIMTPTALTQVTADLLRRLEMNLDLVLADWGTVVQRRASREPLERGGWSLFCTGFQGFDTASPAGHFPLRGNGAGAWPGWPSIPKLEELRDAWFEAPDIATERAIAEEMQRVAMTELPFIPLGGYYANTALRRELRGRISGFPIFWNLQRG
ncbi:ABC transporter substrate-binding protein [Siccirubricoccus sp. KC 17139]|uniref:ABC transporter substrate-binding protein n=1 Tax=Siccirubricoccus soli TaxID=2899147 RepID=A0ABT1DAC7_9PROT|nr:ABC transporter substrate-binding protein [Siccirubricoccus soli]MCO6418895.1 ABC transporter substrate-binding protein [Siccirubricoccus soli]MCP2685030.1 ABC transporter substrate-binding protein [Siccirubricoccus soli]